MKIGIPKEIMEGETRVAVVPSMILELKKAGHEPYVQANAGLLSSFTDAEYESAGAVIVKSAQQLYDEVDLVMKFQAPMLNPEFNQHELELLHEGATIICSFPPLILSEVLDLLLQRRLTSFGMEYLPRITKAQNMDVLSSMSTIAGYKAVLVAANYLGKLFPLLMTAAGTIPPANVFVLGAGVAGLQAIATAKRLGAKVEAFDPRPVVKEQVESLGAQFIKMELPQNIESADGYAQEQPEEFLKKEREVIGSRLPRVDAVITTAQVFGKPSPLLITEEMIKLMKPGSVVVDLAVAEGGNCALSQVNRAVVKYGVTIYGALNLARTVPVHASQMHSRNMLNFFKHVYQAQNGAFNFSDEIIKGTCLTHHGEVVHEIAKKYFKKEKAVYA